MAASRRKALITLLHRDGLTPGLKRKLLGESAFWSYGIRAAVPTAERPMATKP